MFRFSALFWFIVPSIVGKPEEANVSGKRKIIQGVALIALAFAGPLGIAFHAEAGFIKYYVYHSPATERCSVVKGSPFRMYGTPYETPAEAEAAIKADKTCK